MNYTVLLDDIQNNRERFVALHGEDYYGGSDVANICGVGYESPLQVWLRKTGKKNPVEQTPQMAYGTFMEPFLCQLLSERLKEEVTPVNQVWQHQETPWMIASPDALVGDKIAELKAHKIYADKYWAEDTASDSAMCQIHWYMAVSGAPGGYCAALIGGDTEKFYYPYFEADKGIQAQIIEQVESFRALVQSDVPPGAGPGDSEVILEHLRKSEVEEVDLTDSHTDLLTEYKELEAEAKEQKAKAKEYEDRLKAIRNQLALDSAGAQIVRVGSHVVTIKTITRNPYTVQPKPYLKVNIKWGE